MEERKEGIREKCSCPDHLNNYPLISQVHIRGKLVVSQENKNTVFVLKYHLMILFIYICSISLRSKTVTRFLMAIRY